MSIKIPVILLPSIVEKSTFSCRNNLKNRDYNVKYGNLIPKSLRW